MAESLQTLLRWFRAPLREKAISPVASAGASNFGSTGGNKKVLEPTAKRRKYQMKLEDFEKLRLMQRLTALERGPCC